MKNKLLRHHYRSWLISLTLALAIAPTIFAQSNLRSTQSNSTTVNSQSHQFPAAYSNSSWTVAGDRINGVGNATIMSVNPNGFTTSNTSTTRAPERTQSTVVYTNGPLFNQSGTPNLSILQDQTLGMDTYGANISNSAGYGVADDFELVAETQITSISVYAYQTGATTTTINMMYATIWDGDPSVATSSVIWGNNTTNVFGSVENSGTYRVLETSLGDRNRMLQKVNANITGLTLDAGTYWLQYSLAGTASSGPWQPPVVILGNATTGDAVQFTPTGWQPWVDTGTSTPQGLPFQIEGIQAGGAGGDPCSQGTVSNNVENGWGNMHLLILANDFIVTEDETFTLEEMAVNFLLNPGFNIASANIFFYEDTGGNGPGAAISGTSSIGAVPNSQNIIGAHPAGFDLVKGVWTLDTPITFEGSSSGDTVYWMGMQITYSGTASYMETSSTYSTPNEAYLSDDQGATWTSGIAQFQEAMHGVIAFSGQCESSGGGGSADDCEQDFAFSLEDGNGDLRTLLFADDFEIEAGTIMDLEKVTYRLFNNIGQATTIAIYKDNGGIPGALVQSFSNVAPDSQTLIGNNYGFNAYDIEFTLPSVVELEEGIYWVAIQVTAGTDGGINYWVITDDGVHAAGHLSTDGGVTWSMNTSFYNYSFKVEGECITDGGGGGIVYCIPQGTNASRFIENFSTTGGSANISNMGSGFSTAGYGDFYDTHTVAQEQGGFRVWVDWNQDGVFDTTEEVAYNSTGYENSQSGTITVPADALEGDTRMRIVSHWLSQTGDIGPCATGYTYGEFEDYKFTVESVGGGGTPGETCDNSIVVTTLPYDDAGNTATYGNFYAEGDVPPVASGAVTTGTGSSYYLSGNEVVYEYTPIEDEVLNISTTNADDWIGLWAFTGCPFTSTVGYHTGIEGSTRLIQELAVTAGETYYFVISSWAPPESTEYTIHIEKVGGLGTDNQSSTSFSYYPNPTNGVVNITANKDISSVAVYNILGQQVFEMNRVDNGQVDVSALSKGTYLFRVMFEDGSMETFKVLRK